jgi:hypothetical protein
MLPVTSEGMEELGVTRRTQLSYMDVAWPQSCSQQLVTHRAPEIEAETAVA